MSALPVQVTHVTETGATEASPVVAASVAWPERSAATPEVGDASMGSLLNRLFTVAPEPEARAELPEAGEAAVQLASAPWAPYMSPAKPQDLEMALESALPAMQVSSHWSRPQSLVTAEAVTLAAERGASLQMMAVELEQAARARVFQPDLSGLPKKMSNAEPAIEHNAKSLAFHTLTSVAFEGRGTLQTPLDAEPMLLGAHPLRSAAERVVSQMITPSTGAEAAAIPVQKGSQTLVQALAQRIQVQQVQGMDVATVRLDPPQMGSLEIRIRQDALGVQVQMHASHHDVARQLVGVAENLRQELLLRSSDVTVTVASSRFAQSSNQQSNQQHAGNNSERDPEIGQALQAWETDSLT